MELKHKNITYYEFNDIAELILRRLGVENPYQQMIYDYNGLNLWHLWLDYIDGEPDMHDKICNVCVEPDEVKEQAIEDDLDKIKRKCIDVFISIFTDFGVYSSLYIKY